MITKRISCRPCEPIQEAFLTQETSMRFHEDTAEPRSIGSVYKYTFRMAFERLLTHTRDKGPGDYQEGMPPLRLRGCPLGIE